MTREYHFFILGSRVALMSATSTLLQGIKAALRARKLTYRELAKRIGISEATIKRDMSRGNFSLRRLDQICSAMELTLSDLMQPPEDLALVTQLSEAQEIALANQPKILVVTYLLVNDWKFQEIVSAFQMDDNELIDILLRLDRLKIIEYRPPHRVRKLTSRNFSWRTDGPVHKFFVTRFVPEYFQSAFGAPGDAFRFVGGNDHAQHGTATGWIELADEHIPVAEAEKVLVAEGDVAFEKARDVAFAVGIQSDAGALIDAIA